LSLKEKVGCQTRLLQIKINVPKLNRFKNLRDMRRQCFSLNTIWFRIFLDEFLTEYFRTACLQGFNCFDTFANLPPKFDKMRKIQFFLLFAMVAVFAACKKEQVEDQVSPVYPDDKTTSYFNTLDEQGYGGRDLSNNAANNLVADFDLTLNNGTVSEMQDLNITNKSTNAVSYEWDFGNDVKSFDATPSYRYNIHGNYSIALTAIDALGNRQTVKKDLIVLCIFGGGSHDE